MTYTPKIAGTVAKNGALVGTVDLSALDDKITALDGRLTTIDSALAGLDVKLDALTALVQEGGGSGGETPPDTNIYPLAMPADVPVAGTVDIGTGPDIITLVLANTYGTTLGDPAKYCSVAVLIDDKFIAGPLDISGSDDPPRKQNFNIRGSWGALPHRIKLSPGGQRIGMQGLIVGSVMYNFVPLGLVQDTVADSRGTVTPAGSTSIWDNLGVPLEFGPIAQVPLPPPTVDADLINGKTLATLVAETSSGGTLSLPTGTFHGAAVTGVPMTVVGSGTTLTGADFVIPNGKAILNAAAHLSVRDLIFQDAKVPDGNGAGIRPEPNVNLTVERCEFAGNQNGILTPPGTGTITITECHFHDNGAGDGFTHEVYIGQSASVVADNCIFTCGLKSTHAFKSRAKAATLRFCDFKGSPDPAGDVGGSVVDICEGGDLLIEDSTLEVAPGAGNHLFLGYALENQIAGLKTVLLRNVHLVDGTGTGGILQASGGALVIETCTYAGPTPPTLTGWGSVTGQFAPG